MPFGAGIRVCPGREFAVFQIKMVLTQLLLRYSFACKEIPDVYHFDAPYWLSVIAYSPVHATVTRLTRA